MFAFLLTAYRSSSGKTVITSGILRALAARGLSVAPFKCGPDYIDGRWLAKSSGHAAYNLDTVLMGRKQCKAAFEHALAGTDGAVAEGVMGMFDGLSPTDFYGSTYDVAKTVSLPAVLMIDGKGLGASVCAVISGMRAMAEGVDIAGVILNRVSSPRHEQILTSALAAHLPDLPVLGSLPDLPGLTVGSRHLGIQDAEEELCGKAGDAAEKYIDLNRLIALTPRTQSVKAAPVLPKPTKKAYVAYDSAFYFYYASTFDLLAQLGFSIHRFSPLKNESAEGADLILLGGGYPEAYAQTLAASGTTIESIREHHRRSKPVFAECGGFLYLCKNLYAGGALYPMAGIFDISCEMTAARQRLGYVYHDAMEMNGHVFHYSRIRQCRETPCGEITRLATGEKSGDGYLKNRTYGGYTHFMPDRQSKKFTDFIGG